MDPRPTLDGKATFELFKLMATSRWDDDLHPLAYRIFATLLHVLILALGVIGNILLVIAVRRTRSLHTSTYCYLVSLAFADLLVLLSAVPDQIVAHHIGNRWISGQAGCSLMVFANFLGINAGSLSILAFTVDRYIAACRPLLVLKVCNWFFARNVSICLWVFAFLYCAPWLGLTLVKPYPNHQGLQICDFRLSRQEYTYLFIADLVIFYVIPLIFAAVVYFKLGLILRRSVQGFKLNVPQEVTEMSTFRTGQTSVTEGSWSHEEVGEKRLDGPPVEQEVWVTPPQRVNKLVRSRTRVYRMLVVIVLLFAITWLPYRGLLVYNCFATYQWLNPYYLLFAKTCVYINCAINPYLYNIMSRRFRLALLRVLVCETKSGGPQYSK